MIFLSFVDFISLTVVFKFAGIVVLCISGVKPIEGDYTTIQLVTNLLLCVHRHMLLLNERVG